MSHRQESLWRADAHDLVRWRMGMAQCAPFVASHDGASLERRAVDLLPPDAGQLVRAVIFIVARVR